MTKKTEYAIEVERLTKRYGELLAVNDISFAVTKGEVFAFLGANGAGKTALLRAISGLNQVRGGSADV
jgi:ABC-2 type transport system ATP-binding protein